jgi:cell division protein FtsQ
MKIFVLTTTTILLRTAIIAALMGVVYLSARALLALPITDVAISGVSDLQSEPLLASMKPFLAAGFVAVDINALRDQLEGNARIEQADIKRLWPSKLAIAITEQTPVVLWGDDGFLNRHGEYIAIVEPLSVQEQTLPVLSGPEEEKVQIIAHYLYFAGLLQQYNATIDSAVASRLVLKRLSMDRRGNYTALLGALATDQHVTIVLGNSALHDSDVKNNMQRFIDVYSFALAMQFDRIDRVDMRYNNGLAVAWRAEGG